GEVPIGEPVAEALEREIVLSDVVRFMTGNIDDPPVAYERADFWEALGVLGDDFERAWLEVIVRVQPTENIAGGEFESSVDCLGLSSVPLTHPAGEKLLIASDDVDAVVAAAPVHDGVFQVWVMLVEDRQNRLFQVAALVVGGCHDRDFRKRRRHARSPRPPDAPGFTAASRSRDSILSVAASSDQRLSTVARPLAPSSFA